MAYAKQSVGYSLLRDFYAGTTDLRTSTGERYAAQSNLVGWWRLNEDVATSGDVTDSSGNGYTGTFDDDTWRPKASLRSPSDKFIQKASCEFKDDTVQTIDLGDGVLWNTIIGTGTGASNTFTIAAWVRSQAVFDHTAIWSAGSRGTGAGSIILYATKASDDTHRIYFSTSWNGSSNYFTTKDIIRAGVWSHVAITYNASSPLNDPRIYINGVLATSQSWSVQPTGTWDGIYSHSAATVQIGNEGETDSGGNNFTWDGQLADVAIWNRVLTSEEIRAIARVEKDGAYIITRDYNVRGSVATLSSSIDQFRQGVSVRSLAQRYIGMSPKMAAGSAPLMVIDNKLIKFQDTVFDETNQPPRIAKIISGTSAAALSGSTTSLNSARGIISFVPNHQMVRRDFGQPKLFKFNEPYEDMSKWNPVEFMGDCGDQFIIYPYILANVSMKDPDQMDGVIEPLAIRSRASRNSIDWPYEAHSVWGFLSDGAEDSRRHSCPILQQIDLEATSMEPFEDGGYEFMGFKPSAEAVVSGSLQYGAIVSNYGYLFDAPAAINPWG